MEGTAVDGFRLAKTMRPGSSVREALRGRCVRHLVLPAGDLIWKQGLARRLKFLEEAQWWPKKRIAEYRRNMIRALLRIAYEETRVYRQLFDAAGIHWSDVSDDSDLSKLPVVTKALLRKHYPDGTTRDTGYPAYEQCSSGSTGSNFFVKEDAPTAGCYRALFLMSVEWAGWRFGEAHLQTGMTLKRSRQKSLKDLIFGCRYFSAFDLTVANLDRALDILDSENIRHLWGYPGSLYALAGRAIERGWSRSLRTTVTWGDTLYPHYRERIESAFGVRVTDTYGCSEGIQVAAQCEYGTYHTHDFDTLVEIVNDEGKPVGPGESGNVLLTRLHPGPMPLIRYAVGDRCRRASEKSCRCGREMGAIDSIEGRDTDIILTPTGNRLIVHFFTAVLEHFREIEHYQVIQRERDAILIRVVPAAAFTPDTTDRIAERLRDRGLRDMRIDIEKVSQIPPALSGKRRFVISELPRPFVSSAV